MAQFFYAADESGLWEYAGFPGRDDRLLALVAPKFNKIALLTCPKDGGPLDKCEGGV